jgi:hypothetical protein
MSSDFIKVNKEALSALEKQYHFLTETDDSFPGSDLAIAIWKVLCRRVDGVAPCEFTTNGGQIK